MDRLRIEAIASFEKLMGKVERDGMSDLMEYIRESDFYIAPASTKYHGAYTGGLLYHSLNVMRALFYKYENEKIWKERLKDTPEESIVLTALLHDVCKIDYYEFTPCKNEWRVNESLPLGHGEKSVIIIQDYIKLTEEEKLAIRWHMGAYVGQQDWKNYGAAIDLYPLVLALHEADMEASRFLD